MSTTPAEPRPGRGTAGDRGVPSHDPLLFDDPDEPPAPEEPGHREATTPSDSGLRPAAEPPAVDEDIPQPSPRPEPPVAAPDDAAAGRDLPIPPAVAAGGPDTGPGAPVGAPDPMTGVSGVRPAKPVDTGRLYRSAGAEGPLAATAIPARTTGELAAAAAATSSRDDADAGEVPASGSDEVAGSGWVPVAAAAAAARASAPAVPDGAAVTPSAVAAGETPGPVTPEAAGEAAEPPGRRGVDATEDAVVGDDVLAAPEPDRAPGGLTWTGVAVVMTVVTVALAFAQVLVLPGQNVWMIAGVGYLLATVYCAVTVRLTDLWAAFVVPPLAWLVGLLTAGQLTLEGSGSLLVREAAMVFVGLSFNAPWIIGAAIAALVIILVRRARARRAGLL